MAFVDESGTDCLHFRQFMGEFAKAISPCKLSLCPCCGSPYLVPPRSQLGSFLCILPGFRREHLIRKGE